MSFPCIFLEKNYFLFTFYLDELEKYAESLLKHVEDHKFMDFIISNNECSRLTYMRCGSISILCVFYVFLLLFWTYYKSFFCMTFFRNDASKKMFFPYFSRFEKCICYLRVRREIFEYAFLLIAKISNEILTIFYF